MSMADGTICATTNIFTVNDEIIMVQKPTCTFSQFVVTFYIDEFVLI